MGVWRMAEMADNLCRLCEIYRQAGDEKTRQMTMRLIEGIPARERTGEELYAKRLDLCGACKKHVAGTCLSCGCYVELRASKKGSHCPEGEW